MQELQRQIDELKARLEMLESSSTIPLGLEKGLVDRLFIYGKGTNPGASNTQNLSIPAVPASYTIPAQPTGTIPIFYKGTLYNVLYQ